MITNREEYEGRMKERYLKTGNFQTKVLTKQKWDKIVKCLRGGNSDSRCRKQVRYKGYILIPAEVLGSEDHLCMPVKIENQNDTIFTKSYRKVAYLEEFYDILLRIHVKEGGHIGIRRTQENVHSEYECIPRPAIEEFVRMCPSCLMGKTHRSINPPDPLINSGFMTKAQVDLIDMRNQPDGSYKWIGHYVDSWSRFNILFPLEDSTPSELAKKLLSYFHIFGVPKILHSNSGEEFVDGLIEKLLKDWGGTATIVNGFHDNAPLMESGEVLEKLERCFKEGTLKWSAELGSIQYQLNTGVLSSNRATPFEVVFGQPPTDYIFPPQAPLHQSDPLQTILLHQSDPAQTILLHQSNPAQTILLHQSDPLQTILHQSDPLQTILHQSDPSQDPLQYSDPSALHQSDPGALHQSDPSALHQSDPSALHQSDPSALHHSTQAPFNDHDLHDSDSMEAQDEDSADSTDTDGIATIELTMSQKMKEHLLYDGYRLRKDRILADGSTSWRCIRGDCYGRVKVSQRDDVVVVRDHNHDSDLHLS